ncbi:hypothetical protein PENTCL1PPCAC_18216, partial [Pristionchus entomophagus]
TIALLTNQIIRGEEKVETSEQLDPSMYIRNGGMYGNQMLGGMGSNGYNQLTNPMMTNTFSFSCKCASKIPNALAPSPTDANAAAQQQIQQLQEQVRKLTEQVNRQSIAKSGFEQFNSLIAMAQSMDCSCSGNSQDLYSSLLGGGMGGLGGFGGMGGMNGLNGLNGMGMNNINSIERFPQSFPSTFSQTMSGALGGTGIFPGNGAQMGGVPIATPTFPINTSPYSGRFPYKDRR